MESAGSLTEPAESTGRLQGRQGNRPPLSFDLLTFHLVTLTEPDMLQDFSSVTLREARPSVVATERLTLRRPTLADVRTIAHLANDRRVAENTRRLPHP